MFGPHLRELRKWRKLTQKQLADAVKVPQTYISELELNRVATPGSSLLQRLATALGVPLAELRAALVLAPAGSPPAPVPPPAVPEAGDSAADAPPPAPADPSAPAPPPSMSDAEARQYYQHADLLFAGAVAQFVRRSADPDDSVWGAGNRYQGYRTLELTPTGELRQTATYVLVNGVSLPMYWIPTFFDWGVSGHLSLALAHNMLRHDYGPGMALLHGVAFADAVLSTLPSWRTADLDAYYGRGGRQAGSYLEWTLTSADMRAWLLQQPRPQTPVVYVSPPTALPPGDRYWVAQPDGSIRATLTPQFLVDRRLAIEVIPGPAGTVTVERVREQVLDLSTPRLPVWRDARELQPGEYWIRVLNAIESWDMR